MPYTVEPRNVNSPSVAEYIMRSMKGRNESRNVAVYNSDTGLFPASKRFLSHMRVINVSAPKNDMAKNILSGKVIPSKK